MRGSIIPRGKSFRIRFPKGKDANGKYKYHYESFYDYNVAKKRLTEIRYQYDRGTFLSPRRTKLADYLKRWLDDYCRPRLAPRTIETYELIIKKHILPVLGNIEVAKLTKEQIVHLCASKKDHPRTAKYISDTLHKALSDALEEGLVVRNVATKIPLPKGKTEKHQAMDKTEVHLFLDRVMETEYFPLFATSILTGLRRGELLALQWRHVDMDKPDNAYIYVERSLSQLDSGKLDFKETKTTGSAAPVDIPPSLCKILSEHKANQNTGRGILKMDPVTKEDLVFSHSDGSPYLPQTISHTFKKIARRCGLAKFHLHDLRHACATLLLEDGIHPKVVQERLRHRDISTTLNIYSHITKTMQRQAANRLGDIIFPEPDK